MSHLQGRFRATEVARGLAMDLYCMVAEFFSNVRIEHPSLCLQQALPIKNVKRKDVVPL